MENSEIPQMIDDPQYASLRAAILFHDTYEKLAPEYGYETRPDTKQFDPRTPNGRLMIAVCETVLAAQVAPYKTALERIFNLGHNDDCLFCGFKDKEAKAVLTNGGQDADK